MGPYKEDIQFSVSPIYSGRGRGSCEGNLFLPLYVPVQYLTSIYCKIPSLLTLHYSRFPTKFCIDLPFYTPSRREINKWLPRPYLRCSKAWNNEWNYSVKYNSWDSDELLHLKLRIFELEWVPVPGWREKGTFWAVLMII